MFNLEFKKKVNGFSPDARRALLAHSWPGNVRQLSNAIERAMILIESDLIGISDLVLVTPSTGNDAVDDSCWTVPPTGIDLDNVERRLIRSALDQAEDNTSKAARLLGLTRHTLRYRMKKYGFF